MKARALANLGVLALLALLWAWHLVLAPPTQMPGWAAASLHSFVLLPALLLMLRRRRSAPFWGALAALLLFCHGVSEAWSTPSTRTLAAGEIALCVLIVFAASWNGLRARLARRRGV
jgi:uncharacterized membrane protein